MCKIVTFTNSKQLDVVKTVNKVGKILNDIERDGFGYAVQGVKGVFGEKSIDDSFKSRLDLKLLNPGNIIKTKYESFGEKSKPTGPMILHGRTSTNDQGLLNCHPIIKGEYHLVHNGVVTDHGEPYKKRTTNDSEDVLHRFINGIEQVEKSLTGYYAFSCIDPKGQLHLVRDEQARLFIAWCEKLDTFIIATTKSLLESVAKSLGVTIGAIDEIKDNIYMVFQGNDILSTKAIKPRGWDEREARHASKSLGYSIDDSTFDQYNSEFYNDPFNNDFDDSIDYLAENEFREAIAKVDDNCIVWNRDNREITAQEFQALPFAEQKACYIETPDGDALHYWEAS